MPTPSLARYLVDVSDFDSYGFSAGSTTVATRWCGSGSIALIGVHSAPARRYDWNQPDARSFSPLRPGTFSLAAVVIVALAITGICAGTALASSRYTVKVKLPSSNPAGARIKSTVTGVSAKKSLVDFILNKQACSKAISSSQGIPLGTLFVKGKFQKAFNLPLGLPEGSQHLCVYLVLPASGKTLATASAAFNVQ